MIHPILKFMTYLILPVLVPAEPLRAQPDEILLNHSKVFGHSRQQPVRFSHGNHMNSFDCLDCHHRYENKKNVLDPSELEDGSPAAQCTTCHNPGSNCQLQTVFHEMCLGCHTQIRKTKRESGPRLCIDCHPKEPFAVIGMAEKAIQTDVIAKEFISEDINRAAIWALLEKHKFAMRMALRVCAHCGLCAESCFLYVTRNRRPEYMPSHKFIHTLGILYLKKGRVRREELETMCHIAWRRCVLCTRCYCPLGINIPEMITLVRRICRSQNVLPDFENTSGWSHRTHGQSDTKTAE